MRALPGAEVHNWSAIVAPERCAYGSETKTSGCEVVHSECSERMGERYGEILEPDDAAKQNL